MAFKFHIESHSVATIIIKFLLAAMQLSYNRNVWQEKRFGECFKPLYTTFNTITYYNKITFVLNDHGKTLMKSL